MSMGFAGAQPILRIARLRPGMPGFHPKKRREEIMRKALPFALLLAALAVLPRADAAETVKIGILWPLTGNAAAAGQASKAAAEVAADVVNNAHPEMKNLPLAESAGLPGLGGAKLELDRKSTRLNSSHVSE